MKRLPLVAVVGAGALSKFAEGLGGVALIWMVLQMGQGAGPVGYLAAVSLGAILVSSVFGGALVDRFGARRTAIVGSIASAAPIAALVLFAVAGQLDLALLLGLVLLAQLPDGATEAAFEARLPELADQAGVSLERVNGAADLINGLAGFAGAPVAGFIILYAGLIPALWIAFGVGLLAALGAAVFLPAGRKEKGGDGGVFQGFRFIFGQSDLLALMASTAVLIAAFQSFEDVVLPVLVNAAGRGPDSLGIVIGCTGGGAVIGAGLYMVLARRMAPRLVFFSTVSLVGLSLAAMAIYPNWIMLLIAAASAGLGAGALGPLVGTFLQRAAPVGLRGRVLGAAGALSLLLAPVTAGASGVMVDLMGAAGVLGVFAALVIASALSGVMRKDFLEPRGPENDPRCDAPALQSRRQQAAGRRRFT